MNVNDAVRIHLASVEAGHGDFDDTLALIDRFFDYQPTGFHNGPLYNGTGENAGSCRVFSLAQYQQVLDEPAGESHGNIRQFMGTGWSGIRFDGPALRKRPGTTQDDTTEETHP